MTTTEKVISYLAKYKCQLVKKWRYGIPQYRIFKDGIERKYPYVSEDTFCEISDKLEKISDYEIPEGGVYELKESITNPENIVLL